MIKGLIITHKHLDHIRGAEHVIKNGGFDIEYLIINQNYSHPTKPVQDLLKAAVSLKWINLNSAYSVFEGNTLLSFCSPDVTNNSNITAPDINDSSICVTVTYFNTAVHLTGDISSKIALGRMKRYEVSLLKVSHHGSRTGTDNILLDELKPTYAFISAGNSKKYKHPHRNVTSLLKTKRIDTTVSKMIKGTALYTMDKNTIKKSYI